jgi:hypothetical protein
LGGVAGGLVVGVAAAALDAAAATLCTISAGSWDKTPVVVGASFLATLLRKANRKKKKKFEED